MPSTPFIDYYELFQASPNASSETIERLFRYLAKRVHPDVAEGGDVKQFSLLVEAYQTLKEPELRAEYDVEFAKQNNADASLIAEANESDNDTAERYKLLSIFYAKRRRDMKNPGMAPTSLEALMGCPESVLEFHIWYFMRKAWIQREESGVLSITVEGVDRIDEMNLAYAGSVQPRITDSHAPDSVIVPHEVSV